MISGVFIGFKGGMPKGRLEELVKIVEGATGYGAEILEMNKSTHMSVLVEEQQDE